MTYNDSQVQDLLSALTDAIIEGPQDEAFDQLARQYDLSPAQVAGWSRLIRRLHVSLVGVRPSRKYVHRLRQDLMGQQHTLIYRVRYLPARVQIAAGIALVAGFALLARRRVGGVVVGTEDAPALP